MHCFLNTWAAFQHLYETRREKRPFTWQACQMSALITRRCFSLSLLVQFVSAWVLVCSELQSGPRSFIQNQMRVWQHLHLRHLSALQLRLGKSSVSSMPLCFSVRHSSAVIRVWMRCSVNGWLLAVLERVVVSLPVTISFVSVQLPLFFWGK